MQDDDLTVGSDRTLGVPEKPLSIKVPVANKTPISWRPEGPEEPVEELPPSEPTGPLSLGPFGTRYQILKLLGAGGMGAVYQAWDRTLSVVVALKVILTDPTGDPTVARDVERRFKRELLLARQVTHKNVVRIHDLGEIEGIKYITMSYIEGEDLATLLKRAGKLPIAEALRIARQVASGLVAAHEAGVVHRDLKPANIMLDGDSAVIMDFGIARSSKATQSSLQAEPEPERSPGKAFNWEAQAAATGTGAMVGTVHYMPPEQANGKDVDQRADIYALGLILRDMLLGWNSRPGGEHAFDELRGRIEAAPPGVRSVDETIPEPTEELVSQCLQPNPDDRFEKTTDLAAALDRLDDKGELLPIRRVVGLPMVAAAILLLLSLAGGAWWYAMNSIPPPEHEPVSVLIADFQNSTQDSGFNGILEQALGSAMEGASFITAYSRDNARKAVQELKAGDKLDENAARIVSRREGIKVILTGSIESKGSGYAISVNAIDPANGNRLGDGSESAVSKDEVLKAVARVAVRIRTVLGDAKPERLAAAETVSASSLEALQNYQQGQSLAMVGKHEEARDAYLRAIGIDPGFGRAYAALAAAYYHLKDEAKMKAAFDEALKRSDRMTEREKYRTLGNYYLAVARNYEKAIENYESLLRLFPADDSGHGNLGLAYMLLGKLDRAVAEAREVLKIYPSNYLQRYNLSQYLMFSGSFDESIAEGSKVIEQAPTYRIAYLPVALSMLSKGDTTEALKIYDRLEATGDVGVELARIGRADFAMYRGRYREALKITAAATGSRDNSNASAQDFVASAEAALALGQKKQAIDAATKAVSLTTNESVSFPAALVLIDAGRTADAQKIADTLENTLQVQTTAYAHLIGAQIAAHDGRLGAAVEAFQESLKRRDSWFLHFLRGKLYAETKHFPEALGDLEEALKRKGEVTDIFASDTATMRYLPPLYYWLARTQQELGDTTGARKNYEQYVSLRAEADPADPLVADSQKRLGSLPRQ